MRPASCTPTRTATNTASGFSFTVLDMTTGCNTWISNCWWTTKKTIVAMPSPGECKNATNTGGIAPRVAPTSGSRENVHEESLYEQEPVADTRTVPKERVRLEKEGETEQREVGADLRKERVRTEGEVDDTSKRR